MIDLARGTRVAGGDINDAYRVPLADGRSAFVKTRPDAAPGEYAAEAAALRWLAEPKTIRVPDVIEADDAYLALEWVEPGSLSSEGEEELGRGLAGLHRAGAERFGADRLHIGPLTFDASPAGDWPAFYAERLVRPLAEQVGCEPALRVCDRIHDLVGPEEPPARLHGDLWSGNVHADADGHPWLVDPVAYGGHREVDLAMLELFGAPSRRTMAAYEEVAPLADGRADRVALYQLFPLLVHTALFGGSYGASAAAAARRYVA